MTGQRPPREQAAGGHGSGGHGSGSHGAGRHAAGGHGASGNGAGGAPEGQALQYVWRDTKKVAFAPISPQPPPTPPTPQPRTTIVAHIPTPLAPPPPMAREPLKIEMPTLPQWKPKRKEWKKPTPRKVNVEDLPGCAPPPRDPIAHPTAQRPHSPETAHHAHTAWADGRRHTVHASAAGCRVRAR